MILRHTAPLSAADKEKLECFRILRGCLCFWPRKARYWNQYQKNRPGMTQMDYG